MSSPLRIGAEAQAEILDAARWYDDARAGLGEAFLQELDRTFEGSSKTLPWAHLYHGFQRQRCGADSFAASRTTT